MHISTRYRGGREGGKETVRSGGGGDRKLTRLARRRAGSSCGRCRAGRDARRRRCSSCRCWYRRRRGAPASAAPRRWSPRMLSRPPPRQKRMRKRRALAGRWRRRAPASVTSLPSSLPSSLSSRSSCSRTISSARRPRARGPAHARWVGTKSCLFVIERWSARDDFFRIPLETNYARRKPRKQTRESPSVLNNFFGIEDGIFVSKNIEIERISFQFSMLAW